MCANNFICPWILLRENLCSFRCLATGLILVYISNWKQAESGCPYCFRPGSHFFQIFWALFSNPDLKLHLFQTVPGALCCYRFKEAKCGAFHLKSVPQEEDKSEGDTLNEYSEACSVSVRWGEKLRIHPIVRHIPTSCNYSPRWFQIACNWRKRENEKEKLQTDKTAFKTLLISCLEVLPHFTETSWNGLQDSFSLGGKTNFWKLWDSPPQMHSSPVSQTLFMFFADSSCLDHTS